ncbi:MAG: DoxX family protein [Deltaproteobacteria bacterium]|nr:DoxX family protein [Deltaproteobacteria bacterium]
MNTRPTDLALLFIRLCVGGIMLTQHGWGKLTRYSEKSSTFPDPLGVGPELSMALAVFAEVACSALLILGLLSRFAAFQLLFTMMVAAIIVHADDPFNKKELALLYGLHFFVLLLAGPGRFSVDGRLKPHLPELWRRFV